MFKNLRKKKKGFTLIELIIVIAIIGILAAIAIPRFGNATKNAKDNSDAANGKNIANAVTMAIAEGDSNFVADKGKTEVTKALLGSYLQSVPTPSAGGSFYITVTKGDVVVYRGKAGAAGEAVDQVYPVLTPVPAS